MKRIHMLESKFSRLLEGFDGEEYSAGTDHPRWYDEKDHAWWEASWDMDYGFPFGYWSTYEHGMVFSTGDPWSTHENACGKVARMLCEECLDESYRYDAYEFTSALEELVDTIQNYGYTYNKESDTWVSEDGSDEIDIGDWIYDHENSLPYEMCYKYVRNVLNGGNMPVEEDIANDCVEERMEGFEFDNSKDIGIALEECTGTNWDSFFTGGYGMGRVWPRLEIISFYESEQPDPETLRGILIDLQNSEGGQDADINYNDLLEYMIIFRDYDNDDVVTGCTVSDYLQGNYGPEEEPDLDRDRTYGNGETKFIPHLASPEEKKRLGVFKDFQNSRDSKWAPRLKGFGGNMAAYRAARYPYTDSRHIDGDVISENKKR